MNGWVGEAVCRRKPREGPVGPRLGAQPNAEHHFREAPRLRSEEAAPLRPGGPKVRPARRRTKDEHKVQRNRVELGRGDEFALDRATCGQMLADKLAD